MANVPVRQFLGTTTTTCINTTTDIAAGTGSDASPALLVFEGNVTLQELIGM